MFRNSISPPGSRPLLLALTMAMVIPAGADGELFARQPGDCNLRPAIYTCIPSGMSYDPPRWRGHAVALGTNAALGAVSAGIVRVARGESFWEGFYPGAAGGGVSYLGKFVATHETPGAGLIGRQTAALGGSITRNAIAGRGTFETLTFPIGPISIHHGRSSPRITVDLLTVAGTIYGLTQPGAKLDLGRTLSTGAIVFEVGRMPRSTDDRRILGQAIGGTILYRRELYPTVQLSDIVAHETIHVLQHDFAAIAFAAPFEDWLRTRLPAPLAAPLEYLDFSSYMPLRLIPNVMGMRGRDAPWEREAYFLVQESLGLEMNFPHLRP